MKDFYENEPLSKNLKTNRSHVKIGGAKENGFQACKDSERCW